MNGGGWEITGKSVKHTMRPSVPQHLHREEFKRSGTEKRKR